jgi:hypothetical protein
MKDGIDNCQFLFNSSTILVTLCIGLLFLEVVLVNGLFHCLVAECVE